MILPLLFLTCNNLSRLGKLNLKFVFLCLLELYYINKTSNVINNVGIPIITP